jgi:spermidine synthase
MSRTALVIVYWMFFLSGASSLIYEVAWVRSLRLVFGGSHLAVTAVLSVFMGGLALGGAVLGRRIDAMRKPLKFYGFLEIGVAVFAALFLLLMGIYPRLYTLLARGAEGDPLYLTFLRTLFAVIAMIVPTTLMGGTLPVISRFVSGRHDRLGTHLSFLYGFNTLGAVAGTFSAGFFLLPHCGLNVTLEIAIGTNLFIGLAAVALQGRVASPFPPQDPPKRPRGDVAGDAGQGTAETPGNGLPYRMILWGIGISGFCALGYEVLWTRILEMVIGSSVYGFSIMLMAFLAGIALGSQCFVVFRKALRAGEHRARRSFAGFGIVQIAIGIAALGVTYSLGNLPSQAMKIQSLFLTMNISEFHMRLGANFLVAFSYMIVPALFMGLAFPLAGEIIAGCTKTVGGAVGEVVTYNTVGAILGAAASGFALIYLFGIERSLQFLSLINVAAGVWIAARVAGRRGLHWLATGLVLSVIPVLAFHPGWARAWDVEYFAIFRNNQRDAFSTPEKIREAVENTEVLFYHEGINENISVIRVKGANQALLVNGKVVASTHAADVQCEYILGYLPLLLHKHPKKVWVLGMGTGMTLGATSVYPGVEEITLAEIERAVIDGARTFERWNHGVVDNPTLKIVLNDGRNFLLTTKHRYDVITADPIHPWTQGAAYLYTTEYYRIAADRLLPGGIMCQWVPLYELTVADLRSIVRTFGGHFRYMMLWMTHYDAELIGSNEPILIDEAELGRRISAPSIAKDLQGMEMGTAIDFLSYFVAGTQGLRDFARGGTLNTDDNLYLEFSAPRSVGVGYVMGENVQELGRYRESIVPYLVPARKEPGRADRKNRWARQLEAGRIYDRAHALFLWNRQDTGEFKLLLASLEERFPEFAPARFLKREYLSEVARTPRLLRLASFPLVMDTGKEEVVEISAVTMRVGDERAVVMFVDNRAREIYGQLYLDGPDRALDGMVRRFADDVMESLQAGYRQEAAKAIRTGNVHPRERDTLRVLRGIVSSKVTGYPRSGTLRAR